jgi:hypothetical protein
MGKMQRNKGASGEREVLALLSERLGIKLERNLSQTRSGGADCIQLGRIRLEVKRQEQLNISNWWKQAQEQAGYVYIPSGIYTYMGEHLNDKDSPGSSPGEPARLIPVLAYRQSRKPWTFVLDASDIPILESRGHLLHMDIETFCAIVMAHGLSSS